MATFSLNAGGSGAMYNIGTVWATVHDASTGTAQEGTYYPQSSFSSPNYYIRRISLVFDTSSIPSNATITSASLSVTISDYVNTNTKIVHIVQLTKATKTALASSDYNKFGTTTGGSATLPNSNTTATITFNSTGLGWLTKAGTTEVGLRLEGEMNNVTPSNITQCGFSTVSLTVNWTVPSTGNMLMMFY